MKEKSQRQSVLRVELGGVTHLTELSEVNLEGLCMVFEPERDHHIEDVLATDRLTFLELKLLGCFGRDKADELLGVLSNFCCRRDSVLHDARDICNLRHGEWARGDVGMESSAVGAGVGHTSREGGKGEEWGRLMGR